MNREIIFRGKTLKNRFSIFDENPIKEIGDWVYGDLEYQRAKGKCLIHAYYPDGTRDCTYEVDEKTVGQFTGSYDKNGKKIYEGDIIETRGNNFIYKIIYNEKSAAFIGVRDSKVFCVLDLYETDAEYRKIIGNIHEKKNI